MEGVASGAIASDYQRLRVELVCSQLNLVSLAYLWHQPQVPLLAAMISSGMDVILVKVGDKGRGGVCPATSVAVTPAAWQILDQQ